MFNYLFSNGDAHFKNFSLLETPMGDYRLSPAYDLLNSSIHIKDNEFALDEGLLPKDLAQGKIRNQFSVLAKEVGISEKVNGIITESMLAGAEFVEKLTLASFLDKTTQRNYLQSYQVRLKQWMKN